MSWSVNLIGTVDGVTRKLDAIADTLTGQSKEEYLDALPHLKGLVSQNLGCNVRLDAGGHASIGTLQDGTKTKTYSTCTVTLSQFYGEFLQ